MVFVLTKNIPGCMQLLTSFVLVLATGKDVEKGSVPTKLMVVILMAIQQKKCLFGKSRSENSAQKKSPVFTLSHAPTWRVATVVMQNGHVGEKNAVSSR